jgi:hypothetical protein
MSYIGTDGQTQYGKGATTEAPNPAWPPLQQAYLDAVKQFGQNSPEAQQAQLARDAVPKTIQTQTQLGADVQAVKDQGQQATTNIAADKNVITAVGEGNQAQGQQVATDLAGQGAAAQQRQAPTIAVRGQGTQAQQGALGAAVDFAKAPAGPSAAEAQLRMQADRDKRTALALARSARGGPAAVALALRRAQAENAATSAETRGQGSVLRAQETATQRGQNLQAIQIRADIANNTRAMDIDTAKSQLGAELQTIGMNDEQTRSFAGLSEQARQDANKARADAAAQGLNADEAAAAIGLQYANQAWGMLTADQQAEIQRLGIQAGAVQANNADAAAKRQQVLGFFGSLFAAGGAAVSDRRMKKAVTQLRGIAADLRKTPGHEWAYKDGEKHGRGRYTGAMAQDLEKTRTFRGAVKEVGGVKMVDSTRLVMSQQGALHDLQKQIDRLSGYVQRKKSGDQSPTDKDSR